MKTFAITIEGHTPLLCCAFSDAAQIAATEATRAATVGNQGTPLEQAEAGLYLHDDKPVIPQPNILRCIIDAGKYLQLQALSKEELKLQTRELQLQTLLKKILG